MNLAHERHILRLHDDIKRLQDLVQVGGQPETLNPKPLGYEGAARMHCTSALALDVVLMACWKMK